MKWSTKVVDKKSKPAKFSRLARVVLKAKCEGDGLSLFREFLRYLIRRDSPALADDGVESQVVQEIARLRHDCIKEQEWEEIAEGFRTWRRQDKSEKARKSASMRKHPGRKKKVS